MNSGTKASRQNLYFSFLGLMFFFFVINAALPGRFFFAIIVVVLPFLARLMICLLHFLLYSTRRNNCSLSLTRRRHQIRRRFGLQLARHEKISYALIPLVENNTQKNRNKRYEFYVENFLGEKLEVHEGNITI